MTGLTAETRDFNDKMSSVAPYMVAFVLLFAFALMLAAWRLLTGPTLADRVVTENLKKATIRKMATADRAMMPLE